MMIHNYDDVIQNIKYLPRRGSVESFKFLLTQHNFVADTMRGRTVVFGKNSGVSIGGQVILYSGEVRETHSS